VALLGGTNRGGTGFRSAIGASIRQLDRNGDATLRIYKIVRFYNTILCGRGSAHVSIPNSLCLFCDLRVLCGDARHAFHGSFRDTAGHC